MTNRATVLRGAFAVVMMAAIIAYASGITGAAGPTVYTIIGAVGFAAFTGGLLYNRPEPRLPWALFAAGVTLLATAGVLRTALESLGDLASTRPLVPDSVALPAYVLVAIALAALLRSRGTADVADTLLDASVAALATFASSWVFLVLPFTAGTDITLLAQILLACYPAGSMFLVAVSLRLVFDRSATSTRSAKALVIALAAMLVGDVLYMLADLRALDVPPGALDLPYCVSYLALGLMTLDPSCKEVAKSLAPENQVPSLLRLLLVGAGLVVPGALLALNPSMDLTERIVLLVSSVLLAGAVVTRVIRALRAQAASREDLVYQATHDVLTGLPNRAQVREILRSVAARSGTLAVLFLDLDRFKQVNDTLGHSNGDELLTQAGARLSSAVRGSDTVARLGGDEYLILAPVCTADEALVLAERVRWALHEPFCLSRGEVSVSASIGLALSEGDPARTLRLTSDADTALYEAKQRGRDQIVMFDDSMRWSVERRALVGRKLARALENSELSLHYQPIVELSTGQVACVEALVRWNNSEMSSFPDEFIPVAEESGLIVEIGTWVLDEACRHLAQWRTNVAGSENLRVSVNVSARQFLASDFVQVVAETLLRHGLPGSALDLELTERVFLDDEKSGGSSFAKLRSLGVSLSVDDFGTGYSSLSYLKHLPVDKVKIDKSFVDAMATDAADAALVKAVVEMSAALNLENVAEGVEDEAQAASLAGLGCRFVQGYYYSRPVLAAIIPETIEAIEAVHAVPRLRSVN